MEIFQEIYEAFLILLFPVTCFALMGLVMIGSAYYINRTVRKKKIYVTEKLLYSNQLFICKHARCTIWAVAPLGFRVQWSRAEAIFTTDSIFLFTYYKYFGLYPMYQGFIQLYQSGRELPEQMTKLRFFPIGSIDFNEDSLRIKYRYGSLTRCTITLKGIDMDRGSIQRIKELMDTGSPIQTAV